MRQNLWFIMALIPPFLYAITNHIDRTLLEKYFKEGGVGTLIIVSSLLSALALPVVLWNDATVLSVSKENIGVLAGVGVLNVALLWSYLKALKDAEASVVIVFYQLVPVLGLVFGYFILNEVITHKQFVAMVIILVGTSIVSFEIDGESNFKFRARTVGNMFAACACWALQMTVLKKVALEENMWRSLFWENLMMVVVGMLVFAFIPIYRTHFIAAMRSNSKQILLLNLANESVYLSASIVSAFASMMAPVALVLLAEPFQSSFVLVIGTFLTIFFPKILSENIERRHMLQKGMAILITSIGTYFLLTA